MTRPLNSFVILSVALILSGCVAEVAPPRVRVVVPAPVVYVPAAPRAVVSVYVEPPISEPPPIAIGWAPPPLLVESPPPPPFEAAVWVGGYWVWQGDWVWAHGHWIAPPRPDYVWVHPYYENRDGVVLFITGHWLTPGVVFVPPPSGIRLTVEVAAAGVVVGPRPMGPNGCFIPAPPGSRPGIIIPAPVGTAPAVVTGAPPVVAVGMRVTTNVNNTTIVRNNTVVNNTTTNVTNVRNVTNVTNVTIVAPAGATASGQAVNTSVPAQAHLAAAQPALFKAQAPEPTSTKPIPAFVHGKPAAALPPPQAVATNPPAPAHVNANTQHQGNNHPEAPNTEAKRPAAQPAPTKHDEPPAPVAKTDRPHGPTDADRPRESNGHDKTAGAKPSDNAADKARLAGHPNQPKPNQSKPTDRKPNDVATGKVNAKTDHPKKQGDKPEKQEHPKPAS